jgi:L-fuconolactonase
LRVDAHQHYWEPQRGDYGWLTPGLDAMYRDFLPDQLEPLLGKYRMEGSVAVQAAPTVEETKYLLALSDTYPSILGVVGWLDLESPGFAEALAGQREHPKFVGIRPMIQDLPDDWLLGESVAGSMRILERQRFPIDLQLRPRLLDSAVKLMERVPELPAVIDHLAKPDWRQSPVRWQEAIRRLAEYPNVMCKLSGMVPESRERWDAEAWKPYVTYVLDVFGPDRVMYGSDWPVSLWSADYDRVYESLAGLLPAGPEDSRWTGLWGDNAARFYGLR